jgi:hypothetical protein
MADETTLPTLAPGSGKAETAYLWAYVRDDRPFGGSDPPIVVYRFEDCRPVSAWRAIWRAIAASCRWMATRPIIVSPGLRGPMKAQSWQPAGRM